MWTPETRAKYDRRDLRYPSDLRNEEGAEIEPLLPKPSGRGRPREYLLREIINGIRYVLRYGIPWDAMPKALPPWYVVYDYFRKLAKGRELDQINHQLVMKEREQSGREPSPTPVQPWSSSTLRPSNAMLRKESAATMAPRRSQAGSGTWPLTRADGHSHGP